MLRLYDCTSSDSRDAAGPPLGGRWQLRRVWRLERDIERQQGENALAMARNERMIAQVVDLRTS